MKMKTHLLGAVFIASSLTLGAFSSVSIAQTAAPVASALAVWPGSISFPHPAMRSAKAGEINVKKFEAAGFLIQKDSNGQTLLIEKTSGQIVGRIILADIKEVYEWADKDYNEVWISNGQISAEDLLVSIQEPGQVAGKGFYVSLDNSDSISYGRYLTTFHPQRAVVILEYSQTVADKMGSDTTYVLNLAKAGIHALRWDGYNSNWLSVIHTQVLQKPGSMTQEIFNNLVTRLGGETVKGYTAAEYQMQFNANDPANIALKKLFDGKDLTLDELKSVSMNSIGDDAVIVKNYLSAIRNLLKSNLNQIELTEYLNLVRSAFQNSTGIDELNELLPVEWLAPTYKGTAAKYASILNNFDFRTLLAGEKSSKSLKSFSDYVTKVNARLKLIDLKSINSFEELIAATEKVYVQKINYDLNIGQADIDAKSNLHSISGYANSLSKDISDQVELALSESSTLDEDGYKNIYRKIVGELLSFIISNPENPLPLKYAGGTYPIKLYQRATFISSSKLTKTQNFILQKMMFDTLYAKFDSKAEFLSPLRNITAGYSVDPSMYMAIKLLFGYITQAKDDSDFYQRLKIGLSAYLNVNQELVINDPTLQKYIIP